MIGLITKDVLVFKKCFRWIYRLISAIVLAGTVILFPNEGIRYIALMLPAVGVAILTEMIKVEEKSDWREYLPVLPVTNREIVLSRYVFCGGLWAILSVLSFALCTVAAILGGFTLKTVIFDYILGTWFAILMVCFGIPGGYFFKNDLCTGAMMGSCFIMAIVRSMELDAALFALTSPAAYIILLVVTVLMIFVSYGVALWIYSRKRYVSPKLVN